ncbi:DUF6252 family protein [Dyadobacter sp. LHD-138]|uniref:DUF6252 family protein n=1 Tax=Dyadobacter sp. LHD-138 TaxID=3071413 RepID=UPI0027DF0999|nr:DUF6252 family protein [Dyadobacter sp. LHD-138]MDQ6482152.1 DUF6252 family protein [Dyadobacter sp. LHD-138]
MKPKNVIAVNAMIMLIFWACDKGPELTPITQEGKNTFSCKVNGKVWIPDGRGSIFVIIKAINGGFLRNSLTDSVNVSIITYMSTGEEIDIYLRSFEVGVHQLNKSTKKRGEAFNPQSYGWYHSADNKNYMTSKASTGQIVLVKADTISGIIAGTFAFTATAPTGEVIKVTEGRFDIKSPQ